jgi:hypothetical protein
MTQKYCKYGVGAFLGLSMALSVTSALAYQFGPPPITELAEAGGSQNRLSLYSQTTALDGSSLAPTLRGINFSSSTGDNSGAFSGMFRLAQYTDNRKAALSQASDSTGVLIGGGIGKQWYFGAERNFGLLLNGQMDYLSFSYDTKLTNLSTATIDNSQLALGVELGALYRIFVSTATVTPFVTAMKGSRTRNISTTSVCSNCAVDYSYSDSATTMGIDFMMGKFSATLLQTNASYDSSASPSTNSTIPTQKSTVTMFVLGLNY